MFEQRRNLELFYLNDTLEEQNRILRQISDFIIVLSKALCEYLGTQVNLLCNKNRSDLFSKTSSRFLLNHLLISLNVFAMYLIQFQKLSKL